MSLQTRSDMELWDRPFQTQLIAVLLVNVLAHAPYVPLWILTASVIALLYKLGHLYLGWKLPKKYVLYSIGTVIGAAIIFEFKTMLGHEAATPALVFLASLKLLETNRDRDAKFIILTSYFLLMAHLLHSQSLASTFFMAFDVALITILMFQLHRSDRRINSASLRPVVRLLIFTIPIWLCLFVIFPRFTVKLFRSNQPAQATGFNEGLDPGSVSSLAQSNEVAFRATFLSGPRRSPEDLYWRGAALYDHDQLAWKATEEDEVRAAGRPLRTLTAPSPESPSLMTYKVVVEPGFGRALFTLPTVVDFQPGRGLEFLRPYVTATKNIRLAISKTEHAVYTASSVGETNGEPEISRVDINARALKVNASTSAAYNRLVENLKRNSTSVHQTLRLIDDFYSKNDFRYTLSPGDSKSLTVDDFLFRTRKGFCEHFAAASATLLRSVGHPTRVVVGYQGGKWNDVSQALIVRSRDAHAWVEVWHPLKSQPGKGRWITYDPTASIAPLRLRLGGDFLDLPEEEQQGRNVDDEKILSRLSQNLILQMIDRSMMMWDYAQMSWTQFLMNYDRSGQREFINKLLLKLGLASNPWVLTGLVALIFGIGLRLIFLWQARRPTETEVRREWLALEKEFQRVGLVSSNSDGPLTLLERLEMRRDRDEKNSEALRSGITAFINLQYGPPNPGEKSEDLRRLRQARRAARSLRPET